MPVKLEDVWRSGNRDSSAERHRFSRLEEQQGGDGGAEPWISTENTLHPDLGDLRQQQLGGALQPKQGPHEKLQC